MFIRGRKSDETIVQLVLGRHVGGAGGRGTGAGIRTAARTGPANHGATSHSCHPDTAGAAIGTNATNATNGASAFRHATRNKRATNDRSAASHAAVHCRNCTGVAACHWQHAAAGGPGTIGQPIARQQCDRANTRAAARCIGAIAYTGDAARRDNARRRGRRCRRQWRLGRGAGAAKARPRPGSDKSRIKSRIKNRT